PQGTVPEDAARQAAVPEDAARQATVPEDAARQATVPQATAGEATAGEAPVNGGLDEIGRKGERETVADELDAVGAPSLRAPSSPFLARSPTQLSPTLSAVFGTLIGIATVLSLIALMINIDRHRAGAGAAPSTAPSASAAVAAAAEAPPTPKRERQKLPGPWRVADSKGDPKLRAIDGKVGTASFISALTEAGVEQKEAFRVIAAFKGVRDFDKCAKTDKFSALVERNGGRLKAFEYTVGPEDIYQAREGDDGRLSGAKLDLKVAHNQVTGAVVYDGHDFDASAEHAGFDAGLGHLVALALQGHMSMDELERGDTLRLIAQEVTVLGEFARYTGIEALEVRHENPKREALRVYYFDDPALRGYYDASGKSPFEGGWRKPIPGAAITSAFNPRRMHPILHKIMPHLGTDIGAPLGTPVGASAPGAVSYVGPGGPAGNLLKVMHANGIETGYAHLSRYVAGIKVGDKVKRMQTIGYVGSTGRSTGPHLHFSAQRDGKFFDAETLNLDGMRVLNQEQRGTFSAVVAKYNPLLDAIPLPPPLPGAEADAVAVAGAASAAPGSSAAAASPAADDPSLAEPSADVEEAHSKPGNSVYLSDKELLKMQSATDEGEVAE
ncbi:MAG: peptidoglycan DD-metalloendopeptidase family protein, partial [Pseudomonadota bacterium]